ncbi:hypothetical protein NDU88_002949 [Pleurodeles waltl]|uniref:IBB domain-containing protein n=1 Tax=Pleurodeles waltl TaxID=8319 RepID=A0AAV7SCE8_PLEWA|nr:hypothetical protein NDU88_002949 [Pleurodeles waltl]
MRCSFRGSLRHRGKEKQEEKSSDLEDFQAYGRIGRRSDKNRTLKEKKRLTEEKMQKNSEQSNNVVPTPSMNQTNCDFS